MDKPTFITDRLPLQHFLGLMLEAPEWENYMPGILMCMPTRDEMVADMTYMTTAERQEIRSKLSVVREMVGGYIERNRDEIPSSRDAITTRREKMERAETHEAA